MPDLVIPTLNHWPQVIPLGSGGSGVGVDWRIVQASSNVAVAFGDLIEGDTSGTGFNATLPSAASAQPNHANSVIVKNEFGSNALTIVADGTDTLDQGATSFPLAPGNYRMLVSDGVSNWITVAQGPDYINVLAFPGADLGLKIQAADTFLGNTPGTLFVPDGNYTWSTHTTQLHAKRTIIFGLGVITCIGQDPSTGPYPGPMAILNDDTTIIGQGNGTIFDEPDSSVLFAPLTSSGYSNVTFKNFRVENIANGAPLSLGTSLPNIGLDNCTNCRVENVTFINTRSLGVSVGGESFASGHHADGAWVQDCFFSGVKCNTLAAVNARNFHFDHNIFEKVGTQGPAAPYGVIVCIDLEPNGVTDVIEDFSVSDNIFDMRGNVTGTAITVQGEGVGNTGVVANNCIEGGGDGSNSPSGGIVVNGQRNVLVDGNTVVGQFSGIPMSFNGCNECTMSNNIILSSGGDQSGNRSILIRGGSVNCRVVNNQLMCPGAVYIGFASIADSADCTATHVYGNDLLGDGGNPAPTIELAGTNSKQWNNILNGVMSNPNGLVFLEDFQLATGGGTENQGSAVFANIASYPTATLAVPVSGTYEIFARLKGIYSTGAQGEFRLLVDGVPVATTVDQYPLNNNTYGPILLRGSVTLLSGNRVVSAQWRNVNGAGLNLDQTVGGVTYGSRVYGIRN